MSKIVKFLTALVFIYLFLFNRSISEVRAGECVIDIQHKGLLVSSSTLNVTIKAPNEVLGNISQCNYTVTLNNTQKQLSKSVPFNNQAFTLGPGLEPGGYKISVTSNVSVVGPLQNTVCGNCDASFIISSGNNGLGCFSCPLDFYYSPTQNLCIKNNDFQWKTGNPDPIANCPSNECNQNTGKCEGAPIQQVTETPSLGCCPNGYIYNDSSKSCDSSTKTPNKLASLCTQGSTCNATTNKCTSVKTPTSNPPPGGAGQLCFLSDGKLVKDAAEINFAKNNPQLFGIQTAIGCIPTEPTQFILAVSRLATGMGGGIALLLMIAGAFKMITSAGNPDSVKAGSEQITSAVIGLLFIIFAVLLLKVIGVDILDLPGFISP